MITQPEYGERIRFLRLVNRLTQYKLAEIIKCNVGWLSLIERGIEKGNDSLRESICKYFDIDVDTLEPKERL